MIPQYYFEKVKDYFGGDDEKAWAWWKSPNVIFSMISPLEMCRRGRQKRVMKFIDISLSHNSRF